MSHLTKNYTALNAEEVVFAAVFCNLLTFFPRFFSQNGSSNGGPSLPAAPQLVPAPNTSAPSRSHQRKISSSTEFKELTKKDAIFQLSLELEKLSMTAAAPPEREAFESEVSGFKELYQKFIGGSAQAVQWEKIEPLPAGAVLEYSSLREPGAETIREMLNKLVVVKLNGGLGTANRNLQNLFIFY